MSTSPLFRPIAPEDYRISVVLPVYSETDSVRAVVGQLKEDLGPRLHEVLIVISPRSQPASRAVCDALATEDPRVRVHVQRQNPGLGYAVREGYELASGNLVLNIDSDGEMEIETVARLVEAMAANDRDMVIASRWLPGGGFSGYDPIKKVLNWGFQQLFRAAYRTRLHDLTFGYKLMRAELARGIAWEGTLHEIACETTLKPIRLGASVGEVPTRWTARTQGATKNTFLRNFRYVATALKVLVRGASYGGDPTSPPGPRGLGRRPTHRHDTTRVQTSKGRP
jgi:dolichol-phosphate mannosyltransferase